MVTRQRSTLLSAARGVGRSNRTTVKVGLLRSVASRLGRLLGLGIRVVMRRVRCIWSTLLDQHSVLIMRAGKEYKTGSWSVEGKGWYSCSGLYISGETEKVTR